MALQYNAFLLIIRILFRLSEKCSDTIALMYLHEQQILRHISTPNNFEVSRTDYSCQLKDCIFCFESEQILLDYSKAKTK